jgi:3-hexulose-6-phosphate synthase/6-phospho-3-hexuloisomerase
VGTPLLKSEGLEAVRALRREFPDTPIVCDTKTMDAGRVEMEAAAKAGASIAVVMAASSTATIRECVEAGQNYGIQVAVDMLGVAPERAPKVARELADMGVHYICVHTPIDEQMLGREQFKVIEAVRKAIGEAQIMAAGGINSETAPRAAAAGADIVIVGGAIIKAEDVTQAAATIKRALQTGKGRSTTLFRRVGESDVAEVFRRVSTANISDALHRGETLQGLINVGIPQKLIGRAVTVRTHPGDWAKPVEAIDRAKPGEVVVIDAGGVGVACWGELATESAIGKGIEGVVIDGGIRDSGEIRKRRFKAWAKLVTPHAGEPKGFGEIGIPITICGHRISPGDWIIADEDGVVAVPAQRAVEVANRAQDVLEYENRVRREIRDGSTLAQVAQLLRWEKQL